MTEHRIKQRDAFIAASLPSPLVSLDLIPADASFRSYARLHTVSGTCYILMDAPGSERDALPAFIHVADIIHTSGCRSPRIFAKDLEHGFLLLEDFDNHSISRILRDDISRETQVYKDAVSTLVALRDCTPAKDLPAYDASILRREVMLLPEWYVPFMQEQGIACDQKTFTEMYQQFWDRTFPQLMTRRADIVLRDYHADNIHVLESDDLCGRCGLLDFQDALFGDGIYDLVSLLTDIRRDVSDETVDAAKEIYKHALSPEEQATFDERYALFAAQRNCKILGIFVRLAKRDGKTRYLDMLPATRRAVTQACAHPSLEPLHTLLEPLLKP